MKYQIVYETQSGNTELLAKTVASCIPETQVALINIENQSPTKDADVYCIGFGVRHSICSMRLLEFLKSLNGKTLLLFATCGMNPTPGYKKSLERNIEPFLPRECDYRGFFLCQGAISEYGYEAIKRRFAQKVDEETKQRFEEFRIGISGHPDEDDLNAAAEFVRKRLHL